MYIPPKVKEPDKSGIYYDFIPDVKYTVTDFSILANASDSHGSFKQAPILNYEREKAFWDDWLNEWVRNGCLPRRSHQEVSSAAPEIVHRQRNLDPIVPREVNIVKLPNDAFTYLPQQTLGDHMPLDYKIYKYRATLGGIYLEVYSMTDLLFCAGVPWTMDLIAHLDLAVVRDWKRRKKRDRQRGK